MSTPTPRPSPEAIAAARELYSRESLTEAESADIIDEAFAALRAKAEQADSLAKALKRAVTAINAGFGKAQRDHIIAQAEKALAAYAPPADREAKL